VVDQGDVQAGVSGGAGLVGEVLVGTAGAKRIGGHQQHHPTMVSAAAFNIHTISLRAAPYARLAPTRFAADADVARNARIAAGVASHVRRDAC